MPTRLVDVCRDLLGSGVIVVLIVVPLFFSLSLVEPFELAKASAVRGFAGFLLPLLVVLLAQLWRKGGLERAGLRWWLLLLCGYLVVVLASTFTSVAPWVSLWGSPGRSYGALTVGALLTLSLSASVGMRQEVWGHRAALAVMLASFPVTLYGILQWQRQDPLPFPEGYQVPSFFGNPNWIGAWLVMVVPLTLAYLLISRSPAPFPGSRGTRWMPGGILIFLLSLELFTWLVLSGRGAMVGLGVGVFFFLLFVAVLARQRVLAGILGGGVVLVAVLVLLLLLLPPAAPGLPFLVRLGGFSWLQRVLIWESVVHGVEATPLRLLSGFGLDTLGVVLGGFFPTDRASLDVLTVVVWDRAHSVLFDSLATLGVGGVVLLLGLVGSATGIGLRGLRIVVVPSDRRAALGWSVGGGAAGALAFGLLSGRPALAPIGFSGGLLAGVALFLVRRVCARGRDAAPSRPLASIPPRHLVLAGLLAAILAHFAELQSGFQLASSGLLFWVSAGLVLVLARGGGVEEIPAGEQRQRAVRDRGRAGAPAWAPVAFQGLLLGVVLASVAVSLLQPGVRWSDWRLLGLLGSTWLFGSLLLSLLCPPFVETVPLGRRFVGFVGTLGGSLLWSSPFLVVLSVTRHYPLFLGSLPYFLFLALTLLAMVMVLGWRMPSRDGRPAFVWWLLPAGLGVSGLLLAYQVAVVPMMADASARAGRAFLDGGDLNRGIALLQRALRLAPWRDYYAEILAGGYWRKAERSFPPDPWLRQSEALLREASRLNPRDPSHAFNLSTLFALWADLLPSTQSERLADSRRYALLAARLDPPRFGSQVVERLQSILVRQGGSPESAKVEAERLVREASRSPAP